jgi:hypothetical protein
MTPEQIALEKKHGYDMEGYIKKYGEPDQSGGKHLTDEFKLPHHITFSDESIYHSEATPGGKWEKKDETWHYTPSDFVIQQHGEEKLKKYFDEQEPDSVLHLPEKTKYEAYKDQKEAGPE